MKRRSLTLIGAFALLPFALPATPAAGVTPTCDGLTATIVGTDVRNKLEGTEGPDVVWLGGGNDTFVGKGGDDVICAGPGYDSIYPGAGDDTVFGEGDNDNIYEGAGHDQLHGGDGFDKLSYHYAGSAGVRLDARVGQTTGSAGSDAFDSMEVYQDSAGPDTLIGSSDGDAIEAGPDDTVYGLGGKDSVYGRGADTFIDAGDGDDLVDWWGGPVRIRGGAGDDTVAGLHTIAGSYWAGGSGEDLVEMPYRATGLEFNLNQGFIRTRTDLTQKWAITGFESVRGGDGPDLIVGDAGPNQLRGDYGDDVIFGLGGDDSIFGDEGHDRARGGDGADVCVTIEIRYSCELTSRP